RPERRAKAADAWVRLRDLVRQGVQAEDRKRGPEYLLRRHPRLLGHIAEDGRLHEPAALELLALGTLPAGEHLGAAFHGVGDLRLDFRALPLGVQRTHLNAFLEAVADGPL